MEVDNQDKDNEADFFDQLRSKPRRRKRSLKPKTRKIAINISRKQTSAETSKRETTLSCADTRPDWSQWDQEGEDWLSYYSETHEEQDPEFIARENKRHEEELQKQIAALDEKDENMRAEIDKVVSELLKEKQASMERGITSYRERIRQEEKKHSTRLQDRYRERKASNEQKINQRMKQLQQEQQKQLSVALQRHRQHVQQRRLPDMAAAQEWQMTSQQMQAKHQQDRQELTQRTDDYKRRAEMEYQQEQEKIRKVHEQKLVELGNKRTTILSELVKNFATSRQRFLKRHHQRVSKEKEEIERQLGTDDSPAAAAATKPADPPPKHDHDAHSARELAKSAVVGKQELRPPSPLKSTPDWCNGEASAVGAAARYKHRKGLLSSTQIHTQLSIEIHNEGIWILRLLDRDRHSKDKGKSSSSSTSPTNSSGQSPNNTKPVVDADDLGISNHHANSSIEPEFLPWGMRACEFLNSVACGEIPLSSLGNGRRLDFGDAPAMTQTSGQVFCSITDLRTSEETARQQRAVALHEYEVSNLAELEKKVAEFTALTSEQEKTIAKTEREEKQFSVAVDAAIKDRDKATKLKDDFCRRYKQFLGSDGQVLPSVSAKDRQDMENKLTLYKNNQASSEEKVKAATERHKGSQKKLEELQTTVKTARRNAELVANLVKNRKMMIAANTKGAKAKDVSDTEGDRPTTRVKDVIGCLDKVAEKRREQHNQKKSGHISSTWLHSHPALPASFKKSVWRRMHRRKLQVVLRPGMSYLCQEIRAKAASLEQSDGDHEKDKQDDEEERMIRAEQALLLACHPLADPTALSVPTSKSTEVWAEPGWRLDLSVPEDNRPATILPRAPSFPVLEKNLSEVCSVPGRQSAAFLSAFHFRSLASPLSAFATISSPAEISSVFEKQAERNDAERDPLFATESSMRMGYAFNPKAQQKQVSAAQKGAAQSQRNSSQVQRGTHQRSTSQTQRASQSRKKATAKEETEKAAKASAASDKALSSSDRAERKRRTSKAEPSPRKRKKAETAKAADQTAAPSHAKASRKAAPAAQHASRPKPPQIQTQQPQQQPPQQLPPNPGQQPAFPSPHQRQQQLAQLRMMHPGPMPPGYQPPPATMQQMQQYYAPLNHPNGPSPYRPPMSPNVARMHGTAMPMHQGLPMPSPAQTVPMGARPLQPPPQTNQPMVAMPGAPAQPPQPRTLPTAQQQQQQQQPKQDKPGGTKDQNDPLFMLK